MTGPQLDEWHADRREPPGDDRHPERAELPQPRGLRPDPGDVAGADGVGDAAPEAGAQRVHHREGDADQALRHAVERDRLHAKDLGDHQVVDATDDRHFQLQDVVHEPRPHQVPADRQVPCAEGGTGRGCDLTPDPCCARCAGEAERELHGDRDIHAPGRRRRRDHRHRGNHAAADVPPHEPIADLQSGVRAREDRQRHAQHESPEHDVEPVPGLLVQRGRDLQEGRDIHHPQRRQRGRGRHHDDHRDHHQRATDDVTDLLVLLGAGHLTDAREEGQPEADVAHRRQVAERHQDLKRAVTLGTEGAQRQGHHPERDQHTRDIPHQRGAGVAGDPGAALFPAHRSRANVMRVRPAVIPDVTSRAGHRRRCRRCVAASSRSRRGPIPRPAAP